MFLCSKYWVCLHYFSVFPFIFLPNCSASVSKVLLWAPTKRPLPPYTGLRSHSAPNFSLFTNTVEVGGPCSYWCLFTQIELQSKTSNATRQVSHCIIVRDLIIYPTDRLLHKWAPYAGYVGHLLIERGRCMAALEPWDWNVFTAANETQSLSNTVV